MVELFIKLNTDTVIKDSSIVTLSDGDYYSIELNESLQFPVTYSVADIVEPQKRKQSYSKTISVPSTKINDGIFSHAFNVNRGGGFDVRLKSECIVFKDNIEVFKGNLRLTNITQAAHKEGLRVYSYELNLFGELTDIFFDIGKDKLSDLDFSEFNHVYNRFVQSASWDQLIYVNGSSTAFSLGYGYVYPLIDYGFTTDQVNYEVKELKPAIYVKTIWDKILEKYGYSNFFPLYNQNDFRSLIIPSTRSKLNLTQSQIDNFLFSSYSGTNSVINYNFPNNVFINTVLTYGNQIIELDNENFDNGNNFDTSTYKYTAPNRAYYSFQVSGEINIRITSNSPTNWRPYARLKVLVELVREDSGLTVLGSSFVNLNLGNYTTPTAPGATLFLNSSLQPDVNGVFENNGQDPDAANKFLCVFDNVEIGSNVKVFARFKVLGGSNGRQLTIETPGNTQYGGTIDVRVKSNTTMLNKINNTTLLEGNDINMNGVLPENVLISDFMSSIVKMFNLYIQTDKDDKRKLIVYPRNEFYTANTVDWSDKLDYDSSQSIKPLGALSGGRYIYTYKPDNDYFNKQYQDSYGETYGQYIEDVVNDFEKKEVKTELVFSPTPVADTGFSDLVIPRILQEDNSGNIQPFSANIRILSYGGLRTVTGQFFNHNDANGNSTSYTTYPYSGMWDDPFNPTFCLEFGLPKEVYYNNLLNNMVNTNATLYNVYYKQMIDEITSPYSILFTGMFKLDPLDVLNVNFRNQYFFANSVWRLNKIIDYQATRSDLTKCEFIKVIQVNPFVINSEDNGGAIDGLPDFTPFVPVNNNSSGNLNNGGAIITGGDNVVSPFSKSVQVSGNRNYVGSNSENVYIKGDNNVVSGGASNVTIINSNNIEVNQDNITYVDGKKLAKSEVQEILTDTTNNEYYELIEADLFANSIILNIPPAVGNDGQIQRIVINEIKGLNTLTIRAQGDNINGIPELILNKLYNSVTLQSNGKEYFIID